ncbi:MULTISPECIES: PEPxxWA-CTERM sorting domain-containing protein [Sphingomonas]|uniref:PEPxxWA-CTERM sorting domain-containing protein n=1 Tax=Sphingomonas TaxID=13687 RepID=UPI000DEFC698|nr:MULTISPECIES: PEPxxWA-CTERM sorting domain-containing protein [Sphingomonas]
MKIAGLLLAASALFAVPTAANATVVFDVVNGVSSTQAIAFTAGSASTAVTLSGYDVPSFSSFTNIYLYAAGSTTNLLGTHFSFTPAACGSLANEFGGSTTGTNNLSFGGTCTGSYDSFAQTIATIAGASYTLGFNANFSGGGESAGNAGLRADVSNAVAAVPEPGTWALMILGFGAVGYGMRRRRATTTSVAFA